MPHQMTRNLEESAVAQRIQRERKRGWRKPKGSVVVTRGTIWGNPFVVRPDLPEGTIISNSVGYVAVPNATEAVEAYREFPAFGRICTKITESVNFARPRCGSMGTTSYALGAGKTRLVTEKLIVM